MDPRQRHRKNRNGKMPTVNLIPEENKVDMIFVEPGKNGDTEKNQAQNGATKNMQDNGKHVPSMQATVKTSHENLDDSNRNGVNNFKNGGNNCGASDNEMCTAPPGGHINQDTQSGRGGLAGTLSRIFWGDDDDDDDDDENDDNDNGAPSSKHGHYKKP